jgi:hypothetical protein
VENWRLFSALRGMVRNPKMVVLDGELLFSLLGMESLILRQIF